MLSARVLVGLCVVSVCAVADDSATMTSYLDLQMRPSSPSSLTLFDGALALSPVKSDAVLLPVEEFVESVSRSRHGAAIQQMGFTTESDFKFVPMKPILDQSASVEQASFEATSLKMAPQSGSNEQELLRRLQAQDRQIEALQSELQMKSFESSVKQQFNFSHGCGEDCGEGFRSDSDRSCECGEFYPRLIGGTEVPFLKSRLSGAIPVFNVGAAAERMIDSDFKPSIRHHLELQASDSFSVRARHFRFNQSFPFQPPYRPAQLGIEISQTQVEAVFRHRFNRWSFDVSGGFEHAFLEYAADLPTAVGVGKTSFKGVGPVFAMNAAHDIGKTNLSLYCGVRASMLMGQISNGTVLVNVPQGRILDETMQVYSNQMGLQWAPQLTPSIGLKVRAAWETQYWANSTFSDDALGIGSNLNLTGPSVSAQIEY